MLDDLFERKGIKLGIVAGFIEPRSTHTEGRGREGERGSCYFFWMLRVRSISFYLSLGGSHMDVLVNVLFAINK